jgi:2,4-dienoyl-CoA reductase-like NADH-dependent reductase (Old Yellow Enzyme family)
LLFDPITIGGLSLRNRLMRSATAERMAEPETGRPTQAMADVYRDLADGGIGLLVTGHAYVAREGKAHPTMASIASDAMVPAWREVIAPAQEGGARLMMQINHAGAATDPSVSPRPLSPSGVRRNEKVEPAVMTEADIERIIEAFGQAARRVREAGFDGVQLHGAHGYLVNQFLAASTNQRTDAWGGDVEGRIAFMAAVIERVRQAVGDDYPVWIKLGVEGTAVDGPTLEVGARAAALCAQKRVDAVEISHGIGNPEYVDERAEGLYLPMARRVREAVGTGYPLALVGGFRTRSTMEETLQEGVVDLISICRPLILEPGLPELLKSGEREEAACVRCGRCWPEDASDWVRCHNPRLGSA